MNAFKPLILAMAVVFSGQALADSTEGLQRLKVSLLPPPLVHAHEQAVSTAPKVVQFRMTIEEKKVVIDNQGTTLQAMTFDGSMPGPTMVVHEGDYVELTLVNPASNTMPHNIDFHAATGAPERKPCCASRRTAAAPSSTTARLKAWWPGTCLPA